ncbi:MAG TPA: hypothetical protein VFV87_19190, partial [Pirellulaceae bacterium]|nr:hypothetical protein [Pirellulaceae bacterium]
MQGSVTQRVRFFLAALLACWQLSSAGVLRAGDGQAKEIKLVQAQTPIQPAAGALVSPGPAEAESKSAAVSLPERVARLQRTIEGDRSRVGELTSQIDNPDSEYKQAEAEFLALDEGRTALVKDIQALREAAKAGEAEALI